MPAGVSLIRDTCSTFLSYFLCTFNIIDLHGKPCNHKIFMRVASYTSHALFPIFIHSLKKRKIKNTDRICQIEENNCNKLKCRYQEQSHEK